MYAVTDFPPDAVGASRFGFAQMAPRGTKGAEAAKPDEHPSTSKVKPRRAARSGLLVPFVTFCANEFLPSVPHGYK